MLKQLIKTDVKWFDTTTLSNERYVTILSYFIISPYLVILIFYVGLIIKAMLTFGGRICPPPPP